MYFDSSALPAEHQFAAQQTFMRYFSISTPNPEAGFYARSTAWMLDGVIVNLSSLGPIGIRRDKARIDSDSADHYVVIVMVEGDIWEGSFDGVEVRADPGETCIVDMTRPMESLAGPGTSITVLLPRQMLDEAKPPHDVHGLVLDAPAGKLLTDYLRALVARLPSLDAADGPGIARGTRDLLAATLSTTRRRAGDPALSGILLRAKRHIARHLAEDLSAAALSAALGVSRATLFRTFEPMGGLEGFVRARRLARAHELLTRADSPNTISQVAFSVGFKTAAHFARAFRDTYGYTASHLQAGRAIPSPAEVLDGDVYRNYRRWTDRLR
jgi:AraC-like DNA-binding protein